MSARYRVGSILGLTDVHSEDVLAAAPQSVTWTVPATGALHVALDLVYSTTEYRYPHLYTIGSGGPWEAFRTAAQLHFSTWWTTAGAIPHQGTTIAPPTVATPNAARFPGTMPYVELEVIADGRAVSWGRGRVTEIRGILQVDLHVPAGDGTGLINRMADRVKLAWLAAEIDGLSTFATAMPQPLPSPPPGCFGAHVDTSFILIIQ